MKIRLMVDVLIVAFLAAVFAANVVIGHSRIGTACLGGTLLLWLAVTWFELGRLWSEAQIAQIDRLIVRAEQQVSDLRGKLDVPGPH